MSIASRLSNWFRHRKDRGLIEDAYRGRREFVYLDEVSVLSILASRTGRIATESTESQTSSRSSEVKGSLGVGLGGTKANLGTKEQSSQSEASQVSRKAIIQSSFKDLYDIEHSALALRPASMDHLPNVDSILDVERLLGSTEATGLLVDPSTLHRGELLEVEVDLEADPIFRMATIITTFVGLMEDNEGLFRDAVPAQLPEIRSVARLLDNLLAGLVPIRGLLVDYKWIRLCGRDVLIHQALLRQMPAEVRCHAYPAFLVGVAQSDLFWKDIRRVLFSQARYTVFCRLATDGLADRWSPIKMADVFSGITSNFDEMIRGLGDELMSGFKMGVRSATIGSSADAPSTMLKRDAQDGELLLRKYAASLARYHKRDIEPSVIEALASGRSRAEDWLGSVDSYRPVFAEVTEGVDASLGVETPPKVAHDLRVQVLRRSSLDETPDPDGSAVSGSQLGPRCERFLDSEIIAIYW